jgi:hypothetical protein
VATIDEIKARVNEQLLAELTNHGETSATTVDDTRLQLAIDDMEGDFALKTGVAFDVTVAAHLAVAWRGTYYYLLDYTGAGGKAVDAAEQKWIKACARVSEGLGSKRKIPPTTSSVYEPSDRKAGTQPFGDPHRWRDYTLDAPTSEGVDDELDPEADV